MTTAVEDKQESAALRVVNITEEGRYGGPHKRIIEVACQLRQQNIETTVVLPRADSEPCREKLRAHGIPFAALPLRRLRRGLGALLAYSLFFPWEVFQIYRQFRKLRPHIVHCNGSYQVKGMLAAKLAGCRRVWHMNDSFMPIYVRWLFKAVSAIAADKFIAASHRTARFYFPDQPESITVVPAPIQTSQFDPAKATPDPHVAKLDGLKIVTVGNINPIKGYRTLLPATQLLKADLNRPFHVVAVGKLLENQQKYIAELKTFQKKHQLDEFHFWGASDRVREILAAADLYVCASDFEGSPISLWEAMSMGLPVVSTDVADVKMIVESSDCGRVVPTGDARAMADAILELTQITTEERQRMEREARQAAIQHFDLSICVANHARVYRDLVPQLSATPVID